MIWSEGAICNMGFERGIYAPQIGAQEKFLRKYGGHKAAEELVENQRHEAELYDEYKECYGYVFYIGKKI